MKTVWLSALGGGVLLLGASFAPALAADATAYLEQCEISSESEDLPEGVTADDVMGFCECVIDAVGDDQATLDELAALSEEVNGMTPEERQDRFENGEPPSEAAQAAYQSCVPEGPPPGAPAQ